MSEIRTRTEVVGDLPNGIPEPTFTLAQFQGLLREAAAYERAQRPIVMHEAPHTAPAGQTATAGASVYVPMPPAAAFTTIAVERPHNWWPIIFMVSGCTGLAAAATAAATGSQYAILAVFVATATWGTATYQLVFNRKD